MYFIIITVVANAAGWQEVYYKDDTTNKAGLWGLILTMVSTHRTVRLNNLKKKNK
jgi:hypothetical protein